MKSAEIIKLFVSLLACQAAGFLGSLATAPAIPGWYQGLAKPSFTPPSWVFGPAWISLYLMMGFALFLVWRQGLAAPGVKTALVLFIIQLVLNSLWSFLFFGRQQLLWAFVEIVLLWLFILATLIAFWRIKMPAGLLLVPYLAWVAFASALNFAIWRLNS